MWDECAIVDDNKFDRLICRRIVERLKEADDIQGFESSMSFLEFLSNEMSTSDSVLVFLDINMPGMNGLELLKKLDIDPNYKELKERLTIFIMTSSTLTDEIAFAKNYAFVHGIIHKPMSTQKVTDAMLASQ